MRGMSLCHLMIQLVSEVYHKYERYVTVSSDDTTSIRASMSLQFTSLMSHSMSLQ